MSASITQTQPDPQQVLHIGPRGGQYYEVFHQVTGKKYKKYIKKGRKRRRSDIVLDTRSSQQGDHNNEDVSSSSINSFVATTKDNPFGLDEETLKLLETQNRIIPTSTATVTPPAPKRRRRWCSWQLCQIL